MGITSLLPNLLRYSFSRVGNVCMLVLMACIARWYKCAVYSNLVTVVIQAHEVT